MNNNTIDPVFAMQEAMAHAGIPCAEVLVADGVLHRFRTEGDREANCWYVLYLDHLPAGAFGCWKRNLSQKWCAKSDKELTAAERQANQKRYHDTRQQRHQEMARRHQEARERANAIWQEAVPANGHPYLVKKRVRSHHLRIYDHHLIVPLHDADRQIHSLQFISDQGEKRFLPGGRIASCYFLIGEPGDTVCIAEGYATAATIHEATGLPVAAAFNAGNLKPVAQGLREKFPEAKLIVCGDNDQFTDGNPGQTKAREAALAVNGLLAIPEFQNPSGKPTDFNDLGGLEGQERVKHLIEAASLSPPCAVTAHLHTPPEIAKKVDILSAFVERVCIAHRLVGEDRNAKILYLAVTSRVLDEPVSVVVKGVSSSGKSYTTESVLKFFPPSAILPMTAMSEHSLIYMKEEFAHRTLVLYEAVALREQREKAESNLTAYFIRSLLSEGRISYPVVQKGEGGKLETITIVKEGPTNIIITTTAVSLHGENETRLISLPTNDSPQQTKAIMRSLARGKVPEVDLSDWLAFQEWLARAEHRVMVPYASWLAEQIPPVAVRLRRDFRAILRLIETHAILHQLMREHDDAGRIIASEADYLAVRELVADLISEGLGSMVPASIRETVHGVHANAKADGLTVSQIAKILRLDRSTVQRRVQAARERGFLVNVETQRGRPARYIVGDPLPEEVPLLPLRVEGVHAQPDPPRTAETQNFPEETGGVQVCNDCTGMKEEPKLFRGTI